MTKYEICYDDACEKWAIVVHFPDGEMFRLLCSETDAHALVKYWMECDRGIGQ